MTVGSLFTGIGGFDLGLERAGFTIKWQVENNEYARQVLKKHWPSVPCHYDITTVGWDEIPPVDLVCGGFPCQPFSVAGKQRGKADDRYLWPEVVRCLATLRPTWFLGENVPGIINLALDQVCVDLEGLGYEVWPVIIPACAVDAPHIRKRVWIVAHADTERRNGRSGQQRERGWGKFENSGEVLADANTGRLPESESQPSETRPSGARIRPCTSRESRWLPEPAICRVANGIPNRAHRLRGLGNAVVPQIVEALGCMILGCRYPDETGPAIRSGG
jgi:DNA (cytosine-5)-methyltransferase 1